VLLAALAGGASAQQSQMGFFVTSKGVEKGADFGGLEGADRHCQALAAAAGAGNRKWRAYLSASAAGGSPAVNARDRIGRGPWKNAKGVVIAKDLAELHGENKLTKETALTEKGDTVPGRGTWWNAHDILTGTQRDGSAFAGGEDRTCGNWTKSGEEGSAQVGHSDRIGLRPDEKGYRDDGSGPSWNSSHPTRGCSYDAFRTTGGKGYIYCFAAD
jgi:hypothetical protein